MHSRRGWVCARLVFIPTLVAYWRCVPPSPPERASCLIMGSDDYPAAALTAPRRRRRPGSRRTGPATQTPGRGNFFPNYPACTALRPVSGGLRRGGALTWRDPFPLPPLPQPSSQTAGRDGVIRADGCDSPPARWEEEEEEVTVMADLKQLADSLIR